MGVNVNTELRKLRPGELYNLGMILNLSDNWKKLMASVTKEGAANSPKFPGDYISIVEQAAQQEHKLAASIFLEEWSTMGKNRPTIGLLLDLLMETQLFRAADYLAQDILKVAPPKRPSTGPAAALDMDEITNLLMRKNLNQDLYSIDSNNLLRTTDTKSLTENNDSTKVIKDTNSEISNVSEDDVIEIQIAESASHRVLDAIDDFRPDNTDNATQSNLIKFSCEEEKVDYNEKSEALIPNLSLLRMNSSQIEDNANYSLARDDDLASTELPECVAKFGLTSVESLTVADEQDNNIGNNFYYNQELSSAELPLCVNNRTPNISSKIQSDDFFIASSSSILSDESSEIYAGDSMSENLKKNDVSQNFNEANDAPTTCELPLTVLEFQKR